MAAGRNATAAIVKWASLAAALLLTARAGALSSRAKLTAGIEQALRAEQTAQAHCGVLVARARGGQVWYAQNADKLFVCASNAKLFTAAAALEILGPHFRFHTTILADSEPDDAGILRGNLYIKGSGDPTLEDAHLQAMAQWLRDLGVRRVEGDIVADSSAWRAPPFGAGWAWDDFTAYYSVEISAVSLDENAVAVIVTPGAKQGEPCRVELNPATAYLSVENGSVTTSKGAPGNIGVERPLLSRMIVVKGSLALDGPAARVRVSVPDPALFCAHQLRDAMTRLGIEVAGKPSRGHAPPEAVPLTMHRSHCLAEMLPLLLKPSANHIAEQLLHAMGALAPTPLEANTTEAGLRQVNIFLRGLGIGEKQVRLVDGSGLSRLDLASPRAVMKLLRTMRRSADWDTWYESLPAPGEGTLARRLLRTPAEKSLRAKTGSLDSVSALSGYVTTADGEMLVFSFMFNHFLGPGREAREVEDRLILLLAAYSEKG
jgi:D-alanyl-D-alanine carboxypeptidase/D-alanyl-D-alanine-endopeptidase (penicillin-binding protein 4)